MYRFKLTKFSDILFVNYNQYHSFRIF